MHPADVDAVVAFWSVTGENGGRPDDSGALVENLLDRDPEALIVADLDGRIVGTVIAGWDGWRAHLYRLAVDPELRGQGVARLLVGRAEARLARLGAIRFDAMVLSHNAAWSAMGYARQADWARWVAYPDTPKSAEGAPDRP